MPGIDESLLDAMRVTGARGASVVDWISGLSLGSVGEASSGDHEVTATETAEFARSALESGAFTRQGGDPVAPGGPPPVEDLVVTTPDSYHVLRFVGTRFESTVFLHLWIDRAAGNLALARIRLADTADRLVLG
ncbi:hypothetical protein ABZT03_29895 [Streptomyces sp. NPDC005574]|uniref:hypothetical protein n=1 Tax=Streptomyces sp. NPDC005574 TaxID=3156891 RepID=UPI00339DB0D9